MSAPVETPVAQTPAAETPMDRSTAPSVHNGEDSDLNLADEKQVEADPSQDPKTVRPIHGFKWFIAMFAVYSTAFLYGLDTTIAADVQPAIVKSLGQIQKLTWVGVGFPLGSVAVILPLGAFYGLFQAKTTYLVSIVLFEAGSALCGGAPTMDALIVGRVLAGAGGSGMYLAVLTYISVFTTLRERAMYNALCGLVWGLGTILGPVIGGAFADSAATWRWAFYINLVLAGAFAPALLLYLPRFQPRSDLGFVAKLEHLDWTGIILNAGVFTTYVIALTFGGAQWAWNDGRFIATITVFGVLLIAFIVQQYFSLLLPPRSTRVFPGHFLPHRSLLLLYFSTAASATCLFVAAYYIPLFFQFARGDSAIKAAVRLLPFITVVIFACLLNGGLMPVFGRYKGWYIVGGMFQIIGGATLLTINSDSSPAKVYGFSILLAIGTGLVIQAGYAVSAAKVKPVDIPAIVSFQNLAQIGSIVIALTISGTVFQNYAYKHLTTALAGHGYSAQEIRAALAGTQSVIFREGTPEIRKAAIDAVTKAIRNVWALPVAGGVVTLASGLAMKNEKLFMKMEAGG